MQSRVGREKGIDKEKCLHYTVQLFSKWVLSEFLNAFKLELLRTSRGSSFHCLAAVIVNEFSNILVLELGTRSNSLSTERKCRLCESDTLVNRSTIYSGAKPCNEQELEQLKGKSRS